MEVSDSESETDDASSNSDCLSEDEYDRALQEDIRQKQLQAHQELHASATKYFIFKVPTV